jgi:enoyl-CoA hydratase/carnithine racemase
MWSSIPSLMEQLKSDGARVILFRGAGDSFASGADLDELRQIASEDDARRIWSAINSCLEQIWSFELPTIAVIHGSCIGGGCLLACACDFRIATHSASFAIPIAKLGIMIDDRTIARVVAAGGAPFAKQILLAADGIGAERAYELGFLLDCTDSDTGLEAIAQQIAKQIIRNVGTSVAATKQSINLACGLPALNTRITEQAILASYLAPEFKKRVAGV